MIKKIIQIILITFCMLSVGNSAILYDSYNNNDIVSGLNDMNYNNIEYSFNFINSNSSFTINEGVYTRLNTYKQYVLINKNNNTTSFKIDLTYKSATNEDLTSTKTINVSGNNMLTLWVIPDYDTEFIQLYSTCLSDDIGCNSGYEVREFTYTEISEQGLNTIFAPLINGVVDLIIINISIWKILYYLFIASLVIGAITGLVLLGKKFYDYGTEHNIYRHKNHR